ncbi:hypothetical protein V8E51_007315 [Hyaloscypha variabilis]
MTMETKHRFQGPAATRRYKPYILRVPGLLLVFTISLSLVGVLEYAARTLPSTEKGSHDPKVVPGLLHLNRRQIASLTPTTTPAPTPAPTPGAYVQTTGVSTSTTSVAATTTVIIATDPSAYVQATGVSTSTTSVAATTTVIIATDPSAYVQTPGVSTLAEGVATTPTVEDAITTITLIATTSGAYVQTTFSTPSSQETNPANSGPKEETISLTWPLWKVFIGGYLPVLLAILFKVLWTSIYANVKLIEPFVQLADPAGALAKDAFGNFYLSSNITPDPVVSLFKGRWLIFWTSIVYLTVGFLPPLASESLYRDTRYDCPNPDHAQPENPCWPRLSVDPSILRLLQGLLSFVAVMTLTIMCMVSRSSTGISSDPSSIAFVASLIHHPDILADFRKISGQATTKDMVSSLGEKSYRLGNYLGSDDVLRYGIIPGNPTSLLDDNIEMTHASNETKSGRTGTFKRFLDVIFILFILGLLGVILAYYKDGANNGFNRFFNSNSFGPRFFMSAMGTIISMNLKRLEREVQTLSPFHQLARSPSPAGPTILLRKYNVPFSAFVILLAQGHIFSASMAFISFLSEILVVVLAAIPYSLGEIFLELILCTYTSIGILSVMLLVLISLVFWRRRLPYVPRPPDTLGGVISYICDSRMLDTFDGRTSRLGKKYTYGEYVGVDGQVRWMIENRGFECNI